MGLAVVAFGSAVGLLVRCDDDFGERTAWRRGTTAGVAETNDGLCHGSLGRRAEQLPELGHFDGLGQGHCGQAVHRGGQKYSFEGLAGVQPVAPGVAGCG